MKTWIAAIAIVLSLPGAGNSWASRGVHDGQDNGLDGRHPGHGHSGRMGRIIDCDRGDTITDGLARLDPGETLLVSGVCVENVEISDALPGITVDGQGLTVLSAADPTVDVLRIYGDQVAVLGMTISGGRDGINLRGAMGAIIQGNVLENNGQAGLNVHRVSWATAKDNVIRNNGRWGIMVYENSIARIGFTENSAAQPSPNRIEGNGSHGVWVARSSHADVAANVIKSNLGQGIAVERGSHAEIRGNEISGNVGSAVLVSFGSGANLSTGATNAAWGSRANFSTVANGGFALSCTVAGYTAGQVGGLLGTSGVKSITSGCVDVTP